MATTETLIRLIDGSGQTGTCRGCGAKIEWFETLRGKRMPMNAGAVARKSETDTATNRVVAFYAADDSHWKSCPDAQALQPEELTMDGTTKAEIDRVVLNVDVLCALARTEIRSFMPIGLGVQWRREEAELLRLLEEIPARFQRAIKKAQQKGWAAK